MDKNTGLKIKFMSDVPELGRLDSLDIFADKNRDGKSLRYFNLIAFSCQRYKKGYGLHYCFQILFHHFYLLNCLN